MLDSRDEEYILGMQDAAQREAAFCAVSTYRRPDRLNVGDLAPDLELADLQTGAMTRLTHSDRPLVLFFGSYT